MKMINFIEDVNLSGYTLIIPSVSVGNVPQLTVDLLITSYNMKKIATIWHPAIVSSVGSDPYRSDISKICTACELYTNEEQKWAVIQLRSTLESRLVLKFLNDLKDVISSFNLKNVVILSSAFDYELKNITGEKFYYVSNENIDEIMESNKVQQLTPNNGEFIVNGSGIAVKLYEVLSTSINCTLLLKYVSEGDNRPDAFMMLEKLLNLVDLNKRPLNVVLPSSWEFVFGGPPPMGIY